MIVAEVAVPGAYAVLYLEMTGLPLIVVMDWCLMAAVVVVAGQGAQSSCVQEALMEVVVVVMILAVVMV